MAALQAYRSLLRATRLTFQGDERLLAGARDQIRAGFRDKASLSPSDPAVAPAVEHAQQVAAMLRENVVQGKHEGDGRYSKHTKPLFRSLGCMVGEKGIAAWYMCTDGHGIPQSSAFMSIPSGATMTRSRRRLGRLSRLEALGAARAERRRQRILETMNTISHEAMRYNRLDGWKFART